MTCDHRNPTCLDAMDHACRIDRDRARSELARAFRSLARQRIASLEEQRDCGALGVEVAQRTIYGIQDAIRDFNRALRATRGR